MIGLLGSGKTGSYVIELSNHLEWRVFNSKNIPEYNNYCRYKENPYNDFSKLHLTLL